MRIRLFDKGAGRLESLTPIAGDTDRYTISMAKDHSNIIIRNEAGDAVLNHSGDGGAPDLLRAAQNALNDLGCQFFDGTDRDTGAVEVIETPTLTIEFSNTPTSGELELSYGEEPIGTFDINITAKDVQDALRAVDTEVELATVTGSMTDDMIVSFPFMDEAGGLNVSSNTMQIDQIQSITLNHVPASGYLVLHYNGHDTAHISYDATESEIQDALQAVTGLSSAIVSGTFLSKLVVVTMEQITSPSSLTATLTYTLFTNEVQYVVASDLPSAGTITLGYKGHSTSALQYNSTANQTQTALRLLPGLESITVTGTFDVDQELTITMTGVSDLQLLTIDAITFNNDVTAFVQGADIITGTIHEDRAQSTTTVTIS